MFEALTPPTEEQVSLSDQYKYNGLCIIRHNMHPDLKSEYVIEEEQVHFRLLLRHIMNKIKVVILLKANQNWTHLCLQDYKSIEDYNYVIHKIYENLRFCEKEHPEEDNIEKTLQTILSSDRILRYQYHEKNYQTYSDLIHDLLQVENHVELIV
jgi:hypothetical protein